MFTRSPGLSSPRVVTARVWGMSMTENPSDQTSTSVRLTPSTAIDPLETSKRVQEGSSVKARNSHSPSCRRSMKNRGGVDMTLNKMAAQPIANPEGSLKVDPVAGSPVAQISAEQGLRPCLDLKPLAFAGNDREAATVDRDALADRQRRVQTGPDQEQSLARILVVDPLDPTKLLDQTCEHTYTFPWPEHRAATGAACDVVFARGKPPRGYP